MVISTKNLAAASILCTVLPVAVPDAFPLLGKKYLFRPDLPTLINPRAGNGPYPWQPASVCSGCGSLLGEMPGPGITPKRKRCAQNGPHSVPRAFGSGDWLETKYPMKSNSYLNTGLMP